MTDKEIARNRIGSIEPHPAADCLGITLALYFEDHDQCPHYDGDEAFNPWAVEQANVFLDKLAEREDELLEGITEAHKIISVLHMDACDNNQEMWPRAMEWEHSWETKIKKTKTCHSKESQ